MGEILGELQQGDRELLNLLLQGFTTKEIADRLGLQYSNASVRLHRLRMHLRKFLSTKEINPQIFCRNGIGFGVLVNGGQNGQGKPVTEAAGPERKERG